MNSAVSNLRLHCSSMPNIMAFKTLDESSFLEFDVSNAKYLAFDTLDGNALIVSLTSIYISAFRLCNS